MFLNTMLWLVNISELKLIFRFSCCLFFVQTKQILLFIIYLLPQFKIISQQKFKRIRKVYAKNWHIVVHV